MTVAGKQRGTVFRSYGEEFSKCGLDNRFFGFRQRGWYRH